MGMFDSLYDEHGSEWQTKAYDRNLDEFRTGDTLPVVEPYALSDYQVEVLGGRSYAACEDSFATVRGGVLSEVPAERDESLPLLNYSGHLIAEAES